MKKKYIFLIAILLISGCSTGLLRPKVEKGIRDSLPEYIGKAKSYSVNAKGPETNIIAGKINNLHIEGESVELNELTIDKMIIDMENVKFNPRTRAVKSVENTTFSADISEETINKYISKNRNNDDPLVLTINKNQISINTTPKYAGISFSISIKGKPEIRNKTMVDFTADSGSVAAIPVPAFLINQIIDRMNPVLDMSKMKFPIELKEISVRDGYISVNGNAVFQMNK